MEICPNCRKENPDQADFCFQCGNRLSVAEQISTQDSASLCQPVAGDARRNGQAITSLVLGIIAVLLWFWSPGMFRLNLGFLGARLFTIPVVSITGLVLGIRGLKSQKRPFAITGICLTGLGILVPVSLLIVAIVFWSSVG